MCYILSVGPLLVPRTLKHKCKKKVSCLNASITADELHDCIKRLKRNKSLVIDGILSEMLKDGGDVLHNCLLIIFNLMLTNQFPSSCLLA